MKVQIAETFATYLSLALAHRHVTYTRLKTIMKMKLSLKALNACTEEYTGYFRMVVLLLLRRSLALRSGITSKEKKGLNQVMYRLSKTIPKGRAVLLFLLFSQECDTLADTFKDFCRYFEGPNQLVNVSENSDMVKDWVRKLSSACLEEHELRERGVVGMQWTEFRECM